MKIRRPFWLLLVLLAPLFLFAQEAEDAAKEKQRRRDAVLDQIIAETPNLTLGENRALVSARLGNLLWPTDEKRARAMFQNAVAELVDAQTQAESRQTPNSNQNELVTGGTTRPQILQMIASRDAEWALDLLATTRPAAIAKAMAAPAPKGDKISNSNNPYLAANERTMEQSFVRLAAEQNPEGAIKRIKDALAKDISNETLNLLKKLHQKEPEAAKSIGIRIADKLTGGGFTLNGQPDHQKINFAISFINDTIAEHGPNDKSFHFELSQMRSLADKVIAFYLNQPTNTGYLNYSIVGIAEKLSPGSVEALKKVSTGMNGRGGFSYNPELQKLISGPSTADQLLAEAGKYTGFERNQIYQHAVNKLANEGNATRAAAIIKETYADDAYDEAMRNLNWQYSNRLMNEGKFAEAERLLDDMPEQNRFGALVNLANAIYHKNPEENKTHAMAVMQKARMLLPERPENQNEMNLLNQFIRTLINLDPPEAFRVFDRLIPQLNELSEAAVVLFPFQGNGNVRRGEFLMSQGYSFGYFGADFTMIGVLAQKDFDQAAKMVDQIGRREMRIAIRLQLAEIAGR